MGWLLALLVFVILLDFGFGLFLGFRLAYRR